MRQVGIGFSVSGNFHAEASIYYGVTFGHNPTVTVSIGGAQVSSGAVRPRTPADTDIRHANGLASFIQVEDITTTTFGIFDRLEDGQSFPSNYHVGYQWMAVGSYT